MRTVRLTEETKKNILEDLLKRSPNQYKEYTEKVEAILKDVQENGDKAVFGYTEKFDKAVLTAETVRVTEEEIAEAYEKLPARTVEVIRKAIVNIRAYHEKQRRNSWFDAQPDGTILGQKITPIASVGVYVPGGKAAYPSSVLMNVLPDFVKLLAAFIQNMVYIRI